MTPYWTPVGGTSVGSPLIAAAFALAGGAGGVEYPARTLYENAVRVPASLHDIVSGSNGECTQRVNLEGLAPCSASEEAASCSGRAICLAGPGYDGPTGVGTPNGLGAFEAVVNPAKKTQAIEFSSVAPASAKVEGPGYAASANASSGLAVFFTSGTPSVCTVEEATVSFIASGTCTVDADQAGNAEYEAAPQARQSFAVGKGSQVITFTSSAPSAASVDGPAYIVVASASSGLGVSLASGTPSVCSLEGTTVSFTAVGTCTIDASQAGDADYRAAPEAQQSFAVGKRTQVIQFTSGPPGSAAVHGTYAVVASASSGLGVSLTSGTPSVCSLEGTTVSLIAVGTCSIDANQGGNAEYEVAPQAQQSFAVGPTPAGAPSLGALPFAASFNPTPDSSFNLLGIPSINHRSGAITFRASVVDAGTFTWTLTFQNGLFGAFAAGAGRCHAGQVRLAGRCRPAKVLFARGAMAVTSAGTVTLTVRPGASAASALATALRRRLGLSVTATLTFQSALGGRAVSRTRSIADRLLKTH